MKPVLFFTLGKRQIKKSFKLKDSPIEVGTPKQKDFRKRTESLDSIEREIETMQTKTEPEPELEVENSPVSRGLGKKNCFQKVLTHGLRTPNEAFFHQNPKFLGLGRYILWYFRPTVSPLSMFFINQPLFLQKTSLYIRIQNI